MTRKSSAFVPHDLVRPIRGHGAGPLAGLTAATKDMYDIEGERTGGGSPQWLASRALAKTSAAAVTRLLAAGCDIIGKTVNIVGSMRTEGALAITPALFRRLSPSLRRAFRCCLSSIRRRSPRRTCRC